MQRLRRLGVLISATFLGEDGRADALDRQTRPTPAPQQEKRRPPVLGQHLFNGLLHRPPLRIGWDGATAEALHRHPLESRPSQDRLA